MSDTTYPAWFIQMMQDLLDMRDAQKDYFRGPTDYKLKRSKLKEAKADEWLSRLVKAGHIKHKSNGSSNQSSMFT